MQVTHKGIPNTHVTQTYLRANNLTQFVLYSVYPAHENDTEELKNEHELKLLSLHKKYMINLFSNDSFFEKKNKTANYIQINLRYKSQMVEIIQR